MPDAPGDLAAPKTWTQNVTDLDPAQIAIGLGWFSIGLGLVELFGPRRLTRAFGASYQAPLYQLAGVREIASGVGLLLSRDKSPWLWARAAGDAMDIAVLGIGHGRNRKGRVVTALLSLAGIAALDLWTAQRMQEREEQSAHGVGAHTGSRGWRLGAMDIERSITINKSPQELLVLWQVPDTLPRIMAHIADIEQLGQGRARWTIPAPFGQSLAWQTEITHADPDTGLHFRSDQTAGALIPSGAVRFSKAPGNRGTVMTLRVRFNPPGGAPGRVVARLLGDAVPATLIDKSLHYFKALAETGEIPTTAGQPAARADTR
jgi:uncharacterized membrane protein